jgi:tetratricopeptide (TPR) repeat protein
MPQAEPLITGPLETRPGQDANPPAILALLDDAEQAEANGNAEAAAATLERALKIDQNNALIWNRLAGVHMRRGDLQQALVMARKSNTLATGDHSLQLENWFLILAIKQQTGDAAGVDEARRKIEELRRQGAGVSG